MKKYCEECGFENETKIVIKKESYEVCGETIEVNARVLTCQECGEEFYCEDLDSETLVSAYNEYRRRHKLLFAEDIKKIREQYGLSQRSFAKLLNWGDKTIHRYENGSIQDKAHNSLLLFLKEPENMKLYIKENEISLNDKQKDKLLKLIDKLEEDRGYREKNNFFEMLFPKELSEENGFKCFDYEKVCAMVLFFANKNTELLKTKLLKLLNYADMIYYKENGVSITGSRYIHLPYGPVMENSDILFGKMTDDHIARIDVIYEGKYEKHQVVPEELFPEGVLTDAELSVLERIYTRFVDFGSVEISNYSHEEKGYASTKHREIISYSYAKYIDLH
ncbi:type II TA system antitoxin MqsA family protein [Tannockella kyphosi]|uniref:type II TA system antitoxin MqsA family protein n=1 Tax=Tannockella kyphosi TaxID=2899121 RepID=UPI0020128B14|nr:type II TA system antitoxin MqsA family protein [Tannockella kyphosi]